MDNLSIIGYIGALSTLIALVLFFVKTEKLKLWIKILVLVIGTLLVIFMMWEDHNITSLGNKSSNIEDETNLLSNIGPVTISGVNYQVNKYTVFLVRYIGTLRKIEIPEEVRDVKVTEIRPSAFQSNAEIESIILPDTLVRIGKLAFDQCYNLESVNFPPSLNEIGSCAFGNCKKLKSIYVYGNGLVLRENAFWACSNLELVDLDEGVTQIQDAAFGFCSSLQELYLPISLVYIADNALQECLALKDIYTHSNSYAEKWLLDHGYQKQLNYLD